MRITNLAGRLVLGGYLAVHGAQKLFGAFGGKGLDAAAEGFAKMGLHPAKPMATGTNRAMTRRNSGSRKLTKGL